MLPRCLTFILLLFTVSIFSCKRCFVSRLTVICALPSSVRSVGVDIKTLEVGKLSFTRAFNFKKLSWTARDVKFLASYVPTWKIKLLGFFWIIGIMFHICHCSSGKIQYFNRPIFLVCSFFNYAIDNRISNYDCCSFWIEALRFLFWKRFVHIVINRLFWLKLVKLFLLLMFNSF